MSASHAHLSVGRRAFRGMAAPVAAAAEGSSRAAAKLDAALQSGDYYAALQLYRTLVKR